MPALRAPSRASDEPRGRSGAGVPARCGGADRGASSAPCRAWGRRARRGSASSRRDGRRRCAPSSTCVRTPPSTGGGEVDWWIASDLGELATGQRAAHRPRARRRRRVDDAGPGHGARRPRAGCSTSAPGCGIQALHASRHSPRGGRHRHLRPGARVRPVQRGCSPGVALELRAGSMLEPVADERFDLVVSNPPFVITPRTPGMPAYEYRDGGRAGDAIVRELVEGVGGGAGARAASRSCSATGRSAAASSGTSGSAAGSTRPGSTAGWSSVSCRTPRSTPRRGSATAARRPTATAPPGRPGTARGSTTSRRGTSRRSGSAS